MKREYLRIRKGTSLVLLFGATILEFSWRNYRSHEEPLCVLERDLLGRDITKHWRTIHGCEGAILWAACSLLVIAMPSRGWLLRQGAGPWAWRRMLQKLGSIIHLCEIVLFAIGCTAMKLLLHPPCWNAYIKGANSWGIYDLMQLKHRLLEPPISFSWFHFLPRTSIAFVILFNDDISASEVK
jgi:hypothetical protein